MADIHRLTPAGPLVGPEPDVVEQLRKLLEEAERGEIAGFGAFFVMRNDAVGITWAGGCADAFAMECGAARLFFRTMGVKR